jgi:hypothetical protein
MSRSLLLAASRFLIFTFYRPLSVFLGETFLYILCTVRSLLFSHKIFTLMKKNATITFRMRMVKFVGLCRYPTINCC